MAAETLTNPVRTAFLAENFDVMVEYARECRLAGETLPRTHREVLDLVGLRSAGQSELFPVLRAAGWDLSRPELRKA